MSKVMFTVDVEPDWGCAGTRAINEVTPRLLDFMDDHGITATFFVVADMADECSQVLREIGHRHEIASHGLTHRILTGLAPEEAHLELRESKRILEQYGWRILGFRAPFFKIPRGWPRHLLRAGYLYDSSVGSVYPSWRNRNRLRISDFGFGTSSAAKVRAGGSTAEGRIIELPISSLKDGLSPFSLTSLRLYSPSSKYLLPTVVEGAIFYLHLHELLDAAPSAELTGAMRFIQRRNHGEKAWRILKEMVEGFPARFVSCRDYINAAFVRNQNQGWAMATTNERE